MERNIEALRSEYVNEKNKSDKKEKQIKELEENLSKLNIKLEKM